MTDFLTWMATLLTELIEWLGTMNLVGGVSLLGFMAATFVLHLIIDIASSYLTGSVLS